MNPTTGKLAASAVLSSSQSASRSISAFARTSLFQRMIVSLDVKDQMVKRFSSTPKNADASVGSSRGRQAVEYLPSYLVDARSVQTYDAEMFPDGALQLSVAENQMLEDLLVPAYSKFAVGLTHEEDIETHAQSLTNHFPPDHIYYQPTHGRPDVRRNMALFLQKMLKLPPSKSFCEDNLILGAGCNAVLENLAFCLADIGDAVLVPTPYYAAFEFDLGSRAGLKIVPVETQKYYNANANANAKDGFEALSPEHSTPALVEESYYPTVASLDAAYVSAMEETGRKPRILLLSHPNNPLGICYPKEVLQECISWAKQNQVHLISDEIYAGSVYKPPNFHSVLTIASDASNDTKDMLGIGPYVHFVYALSKDFASSGLRVGVAYTENESIVLPLQKLNDLCQISSSTQILVEKMLSPETSTDWAESFLQENQSRIKHRATRLSHLLEELEIPYLAPDSGLFLWMDLSQFLPEATLDGSSTDETQKAQRERTLYLEMIQEYGLLFTPGLSMQNLDPGFFRCVFTAASDHEFELALERFQRFVHSKRN